MQPFTSKQVRVDNVVDRRVTCYSDWGASLIRRFLCTAHSTEGTASEPAIEHSSSSTKPSKKQRIDLMRQLLLSLLFISVLSGLAACTSMRISETSSRASTSASSDVASSSANEQVECRREKVMGSNLTQRVCNPKPSSGESEKPKTQIAKADEAEDQMICRKEKVMGSNLRKRVCYRKKDRESRNRSDQDDYREMSTRAISPGSSNLD